MIHSPSFLGYTRLGAETTAAKTDIREVRNPFTLGGLALSSFPWLCMQKLKLSAI
jgi:hypothetical protein